MQMSNGLFRRTMLASGLAFTCLTLNLACGGSPNSPSESRVVSLTGDLTFPNAIVGSPQQTTLTIRNTGSAPLTITALTGPNWLAANWTSGTIAPGGTQLVSIRFVPPVAGQYAGTIVANADQTGGSNAINVSGRAHPALSGGWGGTGTFSAGGLSNTCNETWIVSGQTGGLFTGTWQSSGGTLASCGQAGSLSGSVSAEGVIDNLTFGVSVGQIPAGCSRVAGDGVFKGSMTSTTLTVQALDTIRCSGLPDVQRSITLSMTRQ